MAFRPEPRRRGTVSSHTLTPGVLFQLVREGRPRPGPSGPHHRLALSTVSQRVDACWTGSSGRDRAAAPRPVGGRPPTQLAFDAAAGRALRRPRRHPLRLAISDLECTVLDSCPRDGDRSRANDVCYPWLQERFADALERGRPAHPPDVRGIGIGVPRSGRFRGGRAVTPPIMPGWDGVPSRPRFADRYPACRCRRQRRERHCPRGTGKPLAPEPRRPAVRQGRHRIGCGIVDGGTIHRGADAPRRQSPRPDPDAGDALCR